MKIGSTEWKALIINGSRKIGVGLTPEQADMMAVHGTEMLNWNRTTNLTAIKKPFDVAVKHFVDSVAPIPLMKTEDRVLDIGSGGGFPGLVLKIAEPSLHMTLVDASRKKVSFLKYMIRRLKLENTTAVHERADVLGKHPDYRAGFDRVTCRAFSSIEAFIDMARPFLKIDGEAIAMKGRDEDALIEPDMHQKWQISKIQYQLPEMAADRCIYIFKRR